MTETRRFEYVEGKSSKFWEIRLDGAAFVVTFGRIGTGGQTQTREFESESKARLEHDKLVREKLAKGYKEVGGTAEPAKEALPKAIPVESPAAPRVEPSGWPRVHWTEAARRRLEPRRPCAKPPSRAGSASAIVQKACAEIERRITAGIPRAGDDLQKVMQLVVDSLHGVPDVLNVDVEAARATLLAVETRWVRNDGSPSTTLLPGSDIGVEVLECWLDRASLAFAVEALSRSFNLGLVSAGEALWLEHRSREHRVAYFREIPKIWRHLRRHLCAAEEAAYDEARRCAEAVRRSGSGRQRCALAYAFPAEAEWANEDARESARRRLDAEGSDSWLLASADDRAAVEALVGTIKRANDNPPLFVNLLATLGPSAFSPLRRAWERMPWEPVLDALALVESEESFAWFADRLDDRSVAAAASESFARAPSIAVPALARVASRSPSESKAYLVLRSILSAHPESAAAAEGLSDAERAIVEKARQSGAATPDAAWDDLPPLLVRPPWIDKVPRVSKSVVEGLEPVRFEERVEWKAGAREASERRFEQPGERERSTAKDTKMLSDLERQRASFRHASASMLFYMTDGLALDLWNTSPRKAWRYSEAYLILRVLSRFGLSALPGLLTFAEDDLTTAAEALSHVRAHQVALLMAEGLTKKRARPYAQEWLVALPEESAAWLIPAAVGRDGPARTSAESALRYLAENGHGDVVRAAARRYGESASAAVEEILAFDPLLLLPARLPKMPAFWTPRTFARPLLGDRSKGLPFEAVDTLGMMLAFSSLDSPYAGLAKVREICDPRSLSEFSWDLFSTWQLAGSPSKESWAFHALGHLGDDEVARRLAPVLREWPHSGQIARAYQGLEILARIGTDGALMHLHGISQKVRSRALQEKAAAKIQEIAEARDLTPEELADRLVPDLGLDRDGSRVLDFGPRSFRVGFDEHLKPYVKDASAKRLAELPKPGKSDDPSKAKEATELWKALKKEARAIASTQIARLELAMCARRRLRAQDFLLFFVAHPLLVHSARRLVWGAFDEGEKLLATFRVAEDGTLADVEDRSFALPGEARVGLLHRLEIPTEQAEAWGQLLTEYEILQPFPQLGRAVHRRSEEEASRKEIDRMKGLKVLTVRVLGLESRGWRRGEVWDGGVAGTMVKPLPIPGYQAELALDPGILSGMPSEFPEQTLGSVALQRKGTWDEASRLRIGDLDEILYSEIVNDLTSLKP